MSILSGTSELFFMSARQRNHQSPCQNYLCTPRVCAVYVEFLGQTLHSPLHELSFLLKLKKNIHCHCVTLLTFKLLIGLTGLWLGWGQIRKFRYLCLWNIQGIDTDMKIMRPTLLCVALSPGTESCLLSVAPSLSCVISLTNIVITSAPGSLTRPLIGQLTTQSPLIGWHRPHLYQGIVITFGHRSHRRNHYTCHQISSPHAEMLSPWDQFGIVQRRKLAVTQTQFLSENHVMRKKRNKREDR